MLLFVAVRLVVVRVMVVVVVVVVVVRGAGIRVLPRRSCCWMADTWAKV